MDSGLLLAVVSEGPDVAAFLAGFQAVAYVALAVVVAFLGINFVRKMFGI